LEFLLERLDFSLLFLLYSRTFPVIAQAEVKTILKSSGERYKNIREAGGSLSGTGTDKRTSQKPKPKKKKE
jgi:molybdopterin-containing oxidoreductase family membrane subunit